MRDGTASNKRLGPGRLLAMEGILTFMGVPYLDPSRENLEREGVRAVFMGIPYEAGTLSNIWRSGSSRGPRGARAASTHLTSYNWELDVDIVDHYNLHDGGDIPIVFTNSAWTREIIETQTSQILDAGAIPVYVGGDHTIPVPAAKALAERVGQMGFLVLDSHLDTADDMYGDKYTACSLHPRFLEFGNVNPENIVVVGHHGNSIRPTEVDWIHEIGITVYFENDIWARGIEDVMNEALDKAWNGTDTVYVSLDTDVVDAAFMPGTTSSEPGGMTSRELLMAARLMGARGIRQIDVAELAPAWDNNEISSRLVVYFLINILAANAWHERSGLEPGQACVQSGTHTPSRQA